MPSLEPQPGEPFQTRRDFLATVALAGAAAAGGLAAGCAATKPAPRAEPAGDDVAILPRGSAPAALALPHFPSRVHAFVWRNWQLVPVGRMAGVLRATDSDVRAVARAMGLTTQPRITAVQQRRSYISVIKRNWHLLPYEQLLELLGWSAAELAFTLREDDFLWVKLGSLKPHCEPLQWAPPTPQMAEQERWIARQVRAEFKGVNISEPAEPLFGFVEKLSRLENPRAGSRAADRETLRFCYSYFALYGDPLLQPELDPFPDGYLQRLSDAGVNGVWLQAVLHKLAPFPWQPELSKDHEKRLRSLAQLSARAESFGIRIFLYLNEPRSLPLSFFNDRPQLKGTAEGAHAALCTSVPEVGAWLAASAAQICRAVPALGGFFTITASENFTNCWSHGGGKGCPRCAQRSPADVIAGVNAALHQGIRAAGGKQRLIAWDWGWQDAWAPEAIARLPDGVTLMSVSEWSLPLNRGGVPGSVGEYCLSAIGPGPRAKKHWELARARGLPAMAKMQVSNTWELSAVPWIPVAANVAEHARRLRALNLDGVMLGWTLGGYPSPNLEAVAEMLAGGTIEALAQRRFGPSLASAMLRAWRALGDAFAEFPFDGGVVYGAPLQVGPANLLWRRPTHYAGSMVGFPYDDLGAWRARYPEAVFIGQLEKVAGGFEKTSAQVSRILAEPGGGSAAQRRAARDELAMMRVAGIHWRSVANQARYIVARNAAEKSPAGSVAAPLRREMEQMLQRELLLARELHAIQSGDSRIGFEASNHYYYVPLDLVEKVVSCRYLLEQDVARA